MRWFVLSMACVGILCGCETAQRVGIAFYYSEASLPKNQLVPGVFYAGRESVPKQSLDLFLPRGAGWPVLVFVHGGGWTSGDKRLHIGMADVYGNIGRYFASRGIGVAVISYRLQPGVTWRDQVEDVASATAWVYRNISRYGGDPERLFLSGHSAGAQLACHVALNGDFLRRKGLSPSIIRGVICVSGAGLDMSDERRFIIGPDFGYYQKRFWDGDSRHTDWEDAASPVTYANPAAPPFLILHGSREPASLQWQSQCLYAALRGAGVPCQIRSIPRQNHLKIVLALSRSDQLVGPVVSNFIFGPPQGNKKWRAAPWITQHAGVGRGAKNR